MNFEQQEQFFKMYEEINQKAERLFDELEQFYRDDAKESRSYRERYEYDGFHIECGYIELRGSYSHQGDWGHRSYDISSKDFLNPTVQFKKKRRRFKN